MLSRNVLHSNVLSRGVLSGNVLSRDVLSRDVLGRDVLGRGVLGRGVLSSGVRGSGVRGRNMGRGRGGLVGREVVVGWIRGLVAGCTEHGHGELRLRIGGKCFNGAQLP
ncbi:hypothetical protein AMIS_62440 [Actinoplanes missouriensis 431]|uniref:Uncharacterized protein n=1 Tax=Actinoplanes missouriensis (strain ATCC 14538 / DSM 43046 / CBS 188.64 / JCM 3121 / NBRC 102363 / NCIMB 12654 / NRRL B-3342 / UNCC 431) TaxID=512565 RepID=I0HEM7_ACTM4|nr:hypothetical protein AMIS_62440 [Actinoplanes missouriensis 431]